jgi:hypothetical protein
MSGPLGKNSAAAGNSPSPASNSQQIDRFPGDKSKSRVNLRSVARSASCTRLERRADAWL